MTKMKKIIIALAALLLLLAIPLCLVFCGYIHIPMDLNRSSQSLAAVSPLNGATDVCAATKITATFPHAVDHHSVEEAFSIAPYAKGVFYWSGDTMTFLSSRNLEYDTKYTIKINEDTWQYKTTRKGFPVTIIDDLGYSITITEKPERIISLAPSNTEILFALGLGDKVVGMTEYCNYPPEAEEKEKIGSYSTPNIEKIVNHNPDLVLAAHGNPIGTVEALKRFNLTVVGLNAENLDEILYDIRLVGEITGQSDNASVLVADMAQRIEVTDERMSGLSVEEKPTVLHIIWHDPIWVAGKGTFEDELIRRSGGLNIAPVEGYKTISLEQLIDLNPEVIITPTGTGMGFAKTNYSYEYIINEPRLRVVEAVRSNRVYVIDADIVCRAGPRIVEALEEMAKIIYTSRIVISQKEYR